MIAVRTAADRLARGAVTNALGQYDLNVRVGGYKSAFVDSTGAHNMQWHDNQPANGLAVTFTGPTGIARSGTPDGVAPTSFKAHLPGRWR